MNSVKLPPDSEGMNADRSEWAEAAIAAFRAATGADRDNALTDLLADLRHWADRNGEDFDHANELAARHYAEETRSVEQRAGE